VSDERLEAIEIGNALLAKLATGELDTLTNTTTESVGISIPEKDAEAPDWFDPETNGKLNRKSQYFISYSRVELYHRDNPWP
jgi:hypothetical protein